MPTWLPSILVTILVKSAEAVAPLVVKILECKYPGFKLAVEEIKKILGDANATETTPSDLVGHIKNFK